MHQLTEERAREFLEAAPVAHIGVVKDGVPYVTPMSFVVDGNRILFRTKPGRRFSAIEANPKVSIEAAHYDTQSGEWTSVIVMGTATVAEDDATKQLTISGLLDKYRNVLGSPLSRGGMQPLASLPHVVAVEIEEISGMSSSGPFSMRTRPGRL